MFQRFVVGIFFTFAGKEFLPCLPRNLALQLEPMNITALCSRGDTKPFDHSFDALG